MNISAPSNRLTFATKTLYASYGFERVWLALVVPGKNYLEAKIGCWPDSETIQALFHDPLTRGNFGDILLHQFQPVRFSSWFKEGEAGGMPVDFLQSWGKQPGFAGTLYDMLPINQSASSWWIGVLAKMF